MHQVDVDGVSVLAQDTFRKLRANSPPGGWFPALQDLDWRITKSNLPHVDIFFSPNLKTIHISIPWAWRNSNIPRDLLPTIASTISALPTSALQSFIIPVDYCMRPPEYFKDSLSTAALRCGPSLVEFTSPISLSEAAVDHLIQLPHLRTWHIKGPPPSYTVSSLPLVFPPLTTLRLGEGAGRGWLSLLKRLEASGSAAQGVTSLSRVKESLQSLFIINSPGPIIDTSLISPIQMFRNLACLNVNISCHDRRNVGQCAFKLNNDDITKLAMALPQLNTLVFGDPCFENTCTTTVACLLPISVYCLKLFWLAIHFNTTNIVEDLMDILEAPKFEELRSLPKCSLCRLNVGRIPLTLDGSDFEIAANAMIDIFPSLKRCEGRGVFEGTWQGLSERIAELQETRSR